MPKRCIVCRSHERECTCIEREMINTAATDEMLAGWEREGFRYVGDKQSAVPGEDDVYLIYRKHSESGELGQPVRVR